MAKNILITGASGYIGSQLLDALSDTYAVTGLDLRADDSHNAPILQADIRDPRLAEILREKKITHVVHLASILESSDDPDRDYDIDVNGTKNVLDASLAAGVKHICITSSGAAYGYHADNPEWLSETDAIRGNDEFPYSRHKRIVEKMLTEYREAHPELQQLILRPGTVLGAHTDNLITNLFTKKRILAIRGSSTPFVFIWDRDVLQIILTGIIEDKSGIYNLAGDGALPIREIARLLGKPTLELPPALLRAALTVGSRIGVTRYGPDQLKFLQYRPVLDNTSLKENFGYTPEMTSRACFVYYVDHARRDGRL